MSTELPPEARARLLADARELAGPAAELLHGRYRILRELGRGGMGVVFEAEDVALRRRVAVKRLVLREAAGPGLAEPVLREARAAARLDHPNIAAVHDAYPDAIVMQFVDGRPLSEHERPPVRELVAWIRDAARAVHHAHEHGIVHRDLKPHNLMIAGERVVVTDFGLAKELAVDTSLSLSGSVLGTPAYMPPEQAGGRAREVDARSDVYALGATLYDKLAGRPPFAEKDLVALLRAVVGDSPRRSPRSRGCRDLALVVQVSREGEGAPLRQRGPGARRRPRALARRARGAREAAGLRYRLAKGPAPPPAPPSPRRHWWRRSRSEPWCGLDRRAGRVAIGETLDLVEALDVKLANARNLGDREGPSAMREQLDEGIAIARAFLARHPEAYQIELKLGELLHERGQDDEALLAIERALRQYEDYAPALVQRGLLRGDLVGARLAWRAFRRARACAPALADLAVAERRAGRAVDVRLARAQIARASRIERTRGVSSRMPSASRRTSRRRPRWRRSRSRGDPDGGLPSGDERRRPGTRLRARLRRVTPAVLARRGPRAPSASTSAAPPATRPRCVEGIPGPFANWARASRRAGRRALRATSEVPSGAHQRGQDRGRARLARPRGRGPRARAHDRPDLVSALCDRALVALGNASSESRSRRRDAPSARESQGRSGSSGKNCSELRVSAGHARAVRCCRERVTRSLVHGTGLEASSSSSLWV